MLHASGVRRTDGAQRIEAGLVGQQGDLVEARQDAVANGQRGALNRDHNPQRLAGVVIVIGIDGVQRQAALRQEVEQDFIWQDFQK